MKNLFINLQDSDGRSIKVCVNHIVYLKRISSESKTELHLSNGSIVYSQMDIEELLKTINSTV